MRLNHLNMLVCPKSKRPLTLGQLLVLEGSRVKEGVLIEPSSGESYVITNFIPRFVPEDNYARSFGVEWAIHNKTQYDAYSGFGLSKERFENETQWGRDLRGQIALEVGSGSGRFTAHALETGATVVSFDYSRAVDANYQSNGNHDELLLVQASVYDMPFRLEFFDKAFCFGVLQHTPDPRGAFCSILRHLKPGGKIAADIYAKTALRWLLDTKYWLRPFIDRRNPEVLYRNLKRYVDLMWPIARLLRRIPRIGHTLNWRLLVADYSPMLPEADDATLKEWAYLDTFDRLSPIHDKPQTLKTFRRWYEEGGLDEINVRYGYNGIQGTGTKRGSVGRR
jgi:SAM-dependent methyltransferase